MKTVQTIKAAVCAAVAALALGSARGEVTYEWKSKGTYTIGKTATYKGEAGEELYYKLGSFTSGKDYTIVTDNSSAEIVYTSTWEGDKYDGTFLSGDYDTHAAYRVRTFVTAEDFNDLIDSMSEGEKLTGEYFLKLYMDGEEDEDGNVSVTVESAKGIIEEPIPVGNYDNPKKITMGTKEATWDGNLATVDDNCYYFTVTGLQYGRRYKFWTEGGTAEDGLGMDITGDCDLIEGDFAGAYDEAWIVTPWDGYEDPLEIVVYGGEQVFTLHWAPVDARTPDKHPSTDLGTITEAGVEADCRPGWPCDPSSGYYDNVIDEQLYKVTLAKGGRYAFWTAGDGVPALLKMQAYDSTGAVLATSYDDGLGGTLVAFDVPATAKNTVYYVGVCQDLYDDEEPVDACFCTFAGKKLTSADATLLDEFDNRDDVFTGATPIDFSPADEITSAEHTLGLTDFEDWFRIDGRSGISYSVKTVFGEGALMPAPLVADIYKANGTKLGELVASGADIEKGHSIDFTKNETYFVRIYLEDGIGLDCGPYTVVSSVSATGGVGLLKINLLGATAAEGAYWQLAADGKSGPQYGDGSSVILATGSYTVNFAAPKNWSKIAAQTVTVRPADEGVSEYTFKYADTASPKDDVVGGATKLTVKHAAQTVTHTLWDADEKSYVDEVDWFGFAGVAGTYYTFELAVRGDPVAASLCDAAGNELAVFGDDGKLTWLCAVKGNYTLKFANGKSASSFTLTYASTNVGEIKLDKASYSVKNSAASVDIKVKRSAAEGRVRVRYTTLSPEGEAVPGVHYDSAKGYLEWADGDKADKTVSVKLIPDLNNRYRGDKSFEFELSPVPEDELEPGEWSAALGAPSFATVKIQEANKQIPGTISFAAYDLGDKTHRIADPKKPAVTVDPGYTLTLWLSRTLGFDGPVSVAVAAVQGTAQPERDFILDPGSELIEWDADDDGLKPVHITLVDREAAAQKFTVKLTAKSGKPAFAGATLTVNLNGNAVVPPKAKDLPLARNPVPVDAKGLVSFGGAEIGSVPLSWTGDEGYTYRVLVGTDTKKLGQEGYTVYDEVTDLTEATVGGLEAGKTYYWTVSTIKDSLVNAPTKAWSFKTVQDVKETVAFDEAGDLLESGATVELRQCVRTEIALGVSEPDEGVAVTCAAAGGTLPAGLKLDTKKGMITGAPTKPGVYSASFVCKSGKADSATLTLNFNVLSAGTAIGTFTGLVEAGDPLDPCSERNLGSASLTVTSAGALTGKITLGKKAYTFKTASADQGFDAFEDDCAALGGCSGMTKDLILTEKVGKATVTNRLTVAVPCGELTDAEALAQQAVFALTLAEETDDAFALEGSGVRENKAEAMFTAALADWAGYYTVALPPLDAEDGTPEGAGYVTVTIDAKGTVKIAGLYADGTSVSASGAIGLEDCVAEDDLMLIGSLRIPFYAGKATTSFGGWLRLTLRDDGESVSIVADPSETIRWYESSAAATRDGEFGFAQELEPMGGYFDKLMNLTAYYLNAAITMDFSAVEEDGAVTPPAGTDTLLAAPGTFGGPIKVSTAGNALTADVPKKKLVKKAGSKTLNDLEASENASNVSLKFTRATGIFSGTFSLWFGDDIYGSETVQKEMTGVKYQGVLTPVNDSGLYAECPGIGAINYTETIEKRKWTASKLFKFDAEDISVENEIRWDDEGWNE